MSPVSVDAMSVSVIVDATLPVSVGKEVSSFGLCSVLSVLRVPMLSPVRT